jgi:hypothetical protein
MHEEIIVPLPKGLLLEHAIERLNTARELEAMLQSLCSEGSVDEFWVEEKDGEVSVGAFFIVCPKVHEIMD